MGQQERPHVSLLVQIILLTEIACASSAMKSDVLLDIIVLASATNESGVLSICGGLHRLSRYFYMLVVRGPALEDEKRLVETFLVFLEFVLNCRL